MIRIHLYDHIKDTYIEGVDLPGVPRVGEEIRCSHVDCRVDRVVWSTGTSVVQVHISPIESRFRGNEWWV